MRARVSSIIASYGWALLGLVLLVAGSIYYSRDSVPVPVEYRVVRGPLERTVSVSGKVIAQSDVELGFSQGGRVGRVRAAVGDTVTAGSLLAEVENDDIRALIAQRRASVSAEEASLRSLLEGARPEEIAVSESAVRSAEIARDQARQSLIEEVQDAYRVADDAVRIKADAFILNPRTQPQLAFITTDGVTKTAVENARSTLEELLPRWERSVFSLTPESDVRAALIEAQKNLVAISTFLVDARTVIAKGLPTGTVTSDDLATYASDTATARSSVNAAVTALTTSDTTLKAAESALITAGRNLELVRAGATRAALDQAEARVEVARASLRDVEAQLKRTQITAPFSGVITRASIETGEIAGQTPVFSLISSGELEIESFIPEIYIADVTVGDAARVELDAYGDALPLTARVVSIEPAETVRDGVATYRTVFRIDVADERVKPGMTASLSIATDKRDGVLAVPQGMVRRDGSATFVMVKTAQAAVRRDVVLGELSSSGLVEIVSGLSEGDVVLSD